MSKIDDNLLRKYCRKVGGIIYTQITVGEHSRHSRHRYLDGVRVIPPEALGGRLTKFPSQEAFKALVKDKTVEAIEADEYLNRWVIGQAIVGKVMLEIEYGVHAAVPVVVCKVRDQSLEQACERLGVKVWTPPHKFLVPVASSPKPS
jgi:ribosomal protein S26